MEKFFEWFKVNFIGIVIGSFLTGAPVLWATHISEKSNDKRHIKDIAFQAAVEEWKYRHEKADSDKKNLDLNFEPYVPPLQIIVMEHMFFLQTLYEMEEELSEDEREMILKQILKEHGKGIAQFSRNSEKALQKTKDDMAKINGDTPPNHLPKENGK